MTRIKVKKLIWDEWNVNHIEKHNLTVEEIEIAVKDLITHERAKQSRYALYGRTKTRILTIIVKREKPAIYYVVTARDAAKKERKKVYEKEKKITGF